MYQINVDFKESVRTEGREMLRDFGFDEDFMGDYLARAAAGELPARITEVQRGRYGAVAYLPGGSSPRDGAPGGGLAELEACPSGRLSHEALVPADLPAVGDWVLVRPNEDGPAIVNSILPRKSTFYRKAPGDTEHDRVEAQVLATNVDFALIVSAAGHDYNPRRIERYLALCRESGIAPVLVLTKADLSPAPELLVAESAALAPGTPCFAVRALEGGGLEPLAALLAPGTTSVLLGSSGAGKSTLLNALAGRQLAKTQDVRADDHKGRHTTTHRELFRLPSGGLVIDNPGIREVQLWAGEEAVSASFEDVEGIAALCRFRDCSHGAEPGCAIREALEKGELAAERWASYRKLMREVRFLASREDPALARAEADRWRVINKSMRGYTKERRSIQGRAR